MTKSASVNQLSLVRKYIATHTLSAFHRSDAKVRGIMGPVGSGKSTACTIEIFRRASQQKPGPDGVRRTRWIVVRNHYTELRTTTLKTWTYWFPESVVPLNRTPPMTAHLKCALPDGTQIDSEVIFVAIDKPKDLGKLLSFDVTGLWLNEARELDEETVTRVTEREGRYPPTDEGGPTWHGYWMDTNPPDDQHWWYKFAEVERPAGWQFFRQPGGLLRTVDGSYVANPLAENIGHLPEGYGYYTNMLAAHTPEQTRVYVLGEYGTTFAGRPVYAGVWSESQHVSKKPLEIYKGLPLLTGCDFGLTPAFIIGQLSPRGQLRILRELQCEDGGLRQFLRDSVRPILQNEFQGMSVACSCDPAGTQRSQVDEFTCLAELRQAGIPTTPAPTNAFLPRRQSVIGFLTRTVDGEPGFILDPSCAILRRGFNGGYQFNRVQVSGTERYRDMPDKNMYSHTADALQYLCLMVEKPLRAVEDPSVSGRGIAVPETPGWGAYT